MSNRPQQHERIFNGPDQSAATVILAHGAGAGMDTDFMDAFAVGLAGQGLRVVRFEFPYMAERRQTGKRRPPDREPVLRQTWLDVIASIEANTLFIGGKSLGGRIASHVAAARDADEAAAGAWWDRLGGLVFLGYPLHPPGKPQQIRVSHLVHVVHPMLAVQGAKDAFGTPAELRTFFDVLPARCEVYAVEHGDHSLAVPKRSGVSQAAVFEAAQARIVAWIRECLGSARRGAREPSP